MWVFGLVDTAHSPALEYMEVVQRTDATTLLPIIHAHMAPRTVVHSDQWRAYSQVSTLGAVAAHNTVNHSVNFVHPVTGTHTQHVESYWNRIKIKLKSMKGYHAHQVTSYLDEFWRLEHHSTTGPEVFSNIMRDYYSPTVPRVKKNASAAPLVPCLIGCTTLIRVLGRPLRLGRHIV